MEVSFIVDLDDETPRPRCGICGQSMLEDNFRFECIRCGRAVSYKAFDHFVETSRAIRRIEPSVHVIEVVFSACQRIFPSRVSTEELGDAIECATQMLFEGHTLRAFLVTAWLLISATVNSALYALRNLRSRRCNSAR